MTKPFDQALANKVRANHLKIQKKYMRIHLIAIGGAAMHNLAIALATNGHQVTGSDDEIYNPSRSRLARKGLLPEKMGWNPQRISNDLDAVIIGMHARKDNPELQKALELGIPVHSYPSYIHEHALEKTRVVIAGSHGKTTTTSMVMHVLQKSNTPFDYLVGAQLEGFETMVGLSAAPLMVIEGDEYLSSPIDRVPKIHHYRPQITAITGIAWDHMNVFPSFENYVEQFDIYLKSLPVGAKVFYYQGDKELVALAEKYKDQLELEAYSAFDFEPIPTGSLLKLGAQQVEVPIFGAHNFQNLKAAYLICQTLGISDQAFLEAIPSFKGASKRLEKLPLPDQYTAYLDFAHAPSKVKATVEAVRNQHPDKKLTVVLELHTFSSLNQAFLPEYAGSLEAADQAMVYYDPHTFEIKKLPFLEANEVAAAFNKDDLLIINSKEALEVQLKQIDWSNNVVLFMSSGQFGGIDLEKVISDKGDSAFT